MKITMKTGPLLEFDFLFIKSIYTLFNEGFWGFGVLGFWGFGVLGFWEQY
jgi:hypothetical protein